MRIGTRRFRLPQTPLSAMRRIGIKLYLYSTVKIDMLDDIWMIYNRVRLRVVVVCVVVVDFSSSLVVELLFYHRKNPAVVVMKKEEEEEEEECI